MSQCFKDSHARWEVNPNQTLSFQLSDDLLASIHALQQREQRAKSSRSAGVDAHRDSKSNTADSSTADSNTADRSSADSNTADSITLYVRKTQLFKGDPIDPYHPFEAKNTYFVLQPTVQVSGFQVHPVQTV
jgi:hypothetical protein